MVKGGCSDARCEDCAAEWGRPVIVEGKLHAFREMGMRTQGMFVDMNVPKTLHRDKVCAICDATWVDFDNRPEPEAYFTYFVGDQYLEGMKVFHEPMDLREYPLTEQSSGFKLDKMVESNRLNKICYTDGHRWTLREYYANDFYDTLVQFEVGDFIEVFDKDNPSRRIFSSYVTNEDPMTLMDEMYFYCEYPAKLTRRA